MFRCSYFDGIIVPNGIIEGSLEVKLPTIWIDGKAEVGRVREEKRREEERRSEKRKRKEDAGARKGRKGAKHCVFPMMCGSGGSKSRLAKATGAEPSGQMRDEKVHAIVARSTFRSVKVTPGHTKCCSRQNHSKLCKPEDLMLQNATPCNPSQETSALTSEHLW